MKQENANAVTEVEITPEMIEAGSEVIQNHFLVAVLDGIADPALVAEDVFRAMTARRKERGSSSGVSGQD